MARKITGQPELALDEPTGVATATPDPAPIEVEAEEIDDAPDVIKSDLRKFNRAKAAVNLALAPLKKIIVIADDAGVACAMECLKGATKVEKLIENKRKDLVKPYNDEVKRINGHAADLSLEIPLEVDRVKKLILDCNTKKADDAKAARTKSRHEFLLHLGLVRFDKGRAGKVLVDHYHDEVTDSPIYRDDLERVSEEVWMAMLNSLQQRRQDVSSAAVGALQEERQKAEFFGETDTIAEIDKKIETVQTVAPRPLAYSIGSGSAPSKTQGLTKRWTFKTTDLSQVPREWLQLDEKKVKEAIAAGTRSIAGLEIYQDESITIR